MAEQLLNATSLRLMASPLNCSRVASARKMVCRGRLMCRSWVFSPESFGSRFVGLAELAHNLKKLRRYIIS